MKDETVTTAADASPVAQGASRLIDLFRKWRYARSAMCLGLVVFCYWGYVLLVVPWIEPAADPRMATAETFTPNVVSEDTEEFAAWFRPGSWQLRNPKILENGPARLLFQEYSNLGDGRVRVQPCTIIYLPTGPASDSAERKRQVVILDAPDGALLQFDRALDLRKAEIGRLMSGQLQGCITVRSEGRLPGPEDDLQIITQDLHMTEQQLSTDAAVDFRYGPNFGRGSHMKLRFASAAADGRSERMTPTVGGLESFELRQVERLHLETLPSKVQGGPAQAGAKPSAAGAAPARTAPGLAAISGGTAGQVPVEVTCRGPMRFEMATRTATLYDQVNVLRLNPEGPSDQLQCESLTVHLQPKASRPVQPGGTAAPGTPPRPVSLLDLEPARVEARGEPVLVLAPARGMEARGRRLDYDLLTGRIVLEGEPARISQGPNEIYAPALQYQPDKSGRMGQIEAKGPGWLQGQMAERPQQRLQARWNRLLRVRPEEQSQVISLTGGAGLTFPEMGQLESQEIHFWMHETPGTAGSSRFQPDRLWADGDVRIGSPQLSAAVQHMEVWFETLARTAPEGVSPRGTSSGSSLSGPLQPTALREPAGEPRPAAPSPQHFDVVGKVLRTRLRLSGQQTEVAELVVEDNVCVRETQTAKPEEKPVELKGDWIRAVEAASPRGTVTVVGRPAQFQGRGFGLRGANINLNRGANRLWVEGAGSMDVPMDRSLDGQPTGTAGRLDLRWQGAMDFRGKTAIFQDSVSAVAAQGHLETEILEVHFKEFIHFQEVPGQQPPKVEQIVCPSGARMEAVEVQGQQQLSVQRAQLGELRLNAESGNLEASGPGWLTRVGQGSSQMLAGRMALPLAGRSSSAPIAEEGGLTCLHVRFQGKVLGNIFRRQMELHERVQMAYGPAANWHTTLDPTRPELLGERGATMVCDRLSIVQMPTPTDGRPALELEALGNTIVESQGIYTARAARMAYTEAKGLLILEGDGRSDARLFRQNSGARLDGDLAAKRIWFWPATNNAQIDGPRAVQLDRFPLGAGKSGGQAPPPKL